MTEDDMEAGQRSEPPLRNPAEKQTELQKQEYRFESGMMLHLMFAGNLPANLKEQNTRLHVRFVSRDNWITLESAEQEGMEKGARFLKELREVWAKRGAGKLAQTDFDQVLNSCAENQPDLLQRCYAAAVSVSPQKKAVIPRTWNQLQYVSAIRDRDVVFGLGPAGSGKTYLAMACAVSRLLKGECERIILTRPAVEAGESLGYLPGTLQDKINPYLRPLYDALYEMLSVQEAEVLIQRGVIEVAPLAYMRGRTLSHAFIILDEAQNTTAEQMLMFLTRMGEGSKCVICGDPTQTDLSRRFESGLKQSVRVLRGIDEIAFCAFGPQDVVRHSLVRRIVEAYQNYHAVQETQRETELQEGKTTV